MAAYRAPDGSDPGRLILDVPPSDHASIVAAITLTFAGLVAFYSIVRPPKTPGHIQLLVASAVVALIALSQLAFNKARHVRLFERGVAVYGRGGRFIDWAKVRAVSVKRIKLGTRRPIVNDIVTFELRDGTKFELTLDEGNESAIAEIRALTAEHVEPARS
jgi:hypothetical protein